MEIKGKIHCLFEKNGLFKNAFKELGYEAYDYDMQKSTPDTDYGMNLFEEINNAYNGANSIFDNMTKDDLVMVFYPSDYFDQYDGFFPFYEKALFNVNNLSEKQKYDNLIKRIDMRERLYIMLYKLHAVCFMKDLRVIVKSMGKKSSYLFNVGNFFPCTLVDRFRMIRWNYYWKSSAYWFFNCGAIKVKGINRSDAHVDNMLKNSKGSEWRSLTDNDYASDFIRDFIIGKKDTQQDSSK